jgi:F1F0 ATPase subunit 2
MNEYLFLVGATVAGLLLGVFFFGGLWFTVRNGLLSQRPAVWFVGSMFLRMSVALCGFYVVSGGKWERILACLLGFSIARFLVSQIAKAWALPQPHSAREADIAP